MKCNIINDKITNPLQIIFLLIQEELAFPLFLTYLISRDLLFLISKIKPITK